VELADRTGGISIFIRGFADQPYFKGPFAGSSLNSLIKVTGYNSRELNQIAETTLARIQRERRVRNARITSGTRWGDRTSQNETVITFKRDRLAQYGISVGYVLGTVRRLLGVDTPWTMLIDGEQELSTLLNEKVGEVKATILERDGKILQTAHRPVVGFDKFPDVPWHLLDFEAYVERQNDTRNWKVRHKYPDPWRMSPNEPLRGFSYFSSFGCPEPCTFCCSPMVTNRRWKALPGKLLAERLLECKERFNFNIVRFQDDYGRKA